MKAAPFEYVRAEMISDATAALAQDGLSTAAIAGGQSLLPMLSLRVALPDLLVDIGRLSELKEVSETATSIRIGALTTHAAIEDGETPDQFRGLLRQTAAKISYRAIRHFGTIGGSVALADPAADWPGCLLALDATVRIAGRTSTRSQPIDEFLLGQYTTSLAPDEIIVGFDLPKPTAPLRWGLHKVVRKSGAFANSIAFAVAHGDGGPTSVVLAAAASRPHRLPTVADAIRSGPIPEARLRAAIAADLDAHVQPEDAYLARLHTSSILRSIHQMQVQ